NDTHFQADAAVRNNRADVAVADDPERCSKQLDAHELRFFPFAGLSGSIGLRDLAGERQHQRDRVLRGRDRVAVRRVHHDDATGRRSTRIDIVDPDAGAAYDLQPLAGGDDLLGDLGGGPYGEAVVVADNLFELILREADLHVDIDTALLEYGNGGRRKLVGNENLGSHEEKSFWNGFASFRL